MKNISLIFVTLVVIFLAGCKEFFQIDVRYPITIENNSDVGISTYLALGEIEGDSAYPDTTLSFYKRWIKKGTKPWSKATHDLSRYDHLERFERLPQDTLSIFIFSSDVLNNNDWEDIQANYMILRRYDLSYKDLMRLLNKYGVPSIPYPPTEKMKEMKMFPPY